MLELWGGVECTVNRVGDHYFNQMARNGHRHRIEDLDRFAALGLRTLRYPLLWELIAPHGLAAADWSWADARMHRLRALGIRPIVGLVHHGSGPRATDLLDPAFAEGLAEFAAAVAQRYPWVDAYTPVNEPLTTARFSGLYGHWYPHTRDMRLMAEMLLNECRGVALAMAAVRRVNPAAQLIQTEDLGKTYSTPTLAYQAEFENERRWLSLDLLTGQLDADRPQWHYLCEHGISAEDLAWFAAHPCPPDVIGINHYLTSERWLDERMERYPAATHGGNGRHEYADVEAVRVVADGLGGHRQLLREAWERYHLPLAVTEAHLGCTREEQLRWLYATWQAAEALRAEDIPVRAVTVWALLGSFDWNSLVTRTTGFYEPGAFDVRAPQPRPTALAGLTHDLATGQTPTHPALASTGWWERPERLFYPPVVVGLPRHDPAPTPPARPILITGATGTLGRTLARQCAVRGLAHQSLTRHELEITDDAAIAAAIARWQPWAIINTAGFVRVDDAEEDAQACFQANGWGPALLARACAQADIRLVTLSSDLVFDGTKGGAYVESDVPHPLNAYGRAKAFAEQAINNILPEALIIRTAAFFGPDDPYNFVTQAVTTLAQGGPFTAADDCIVSPTYVPDLAAALLDLLIDGEQGIWHLTNAGALSWADLARHAALLCGCDARLIQPRPAHALGWRAARPRQSALRSARGTLMPTLEDALTRYAAQSSLAYSR